MSRKIKVAISTIDLSVALPYQWALLKTYADEDPTLATSVIWEKPIHYSVKKIRNLINKPSQLVKEYNLKEVDILGVSCYTWNTEHQVKIAEIVKKVNPRCIIVAGGPDLSYADPKLFEIYPLFDVVVKSDGEIPFKKILQTVIAGNRSFTDISGLVIPTENGPQDTGPPEVLKNFHLSPWLHNKTELEKCVQRLRSENEAIRIVYETNRGCPYSCTYCNWGSNTKSKIRNFDLENIRSEVEWFCHIQADKIMICDANFGIIPRDLEITDYLVNLGRNSPPPHIVFYPAKNNSDRVVDISIKLFDAKLLASFSLGVQNTDLKVLAAVGRANMRLKEQKSVADGLRKRGIPVIASLILGCPGDTVDTWRQTLIDMIEIGVEDMQAWRFHVLANTMAADKKYQEKWQIKTIQRRDETYHYKADYIRSTSTYSSSDLVEMELYYFMTQAVKSLEIVIDVRNLLQQKWGITYRQFYDGLFDQFFNNAENKWVNVLQILRTHLTDFLTIEDLKGVFKFIVCQNSEGNFVNAYKHRTFLSARIHEDLKSFTLDFLQYVDNWYPLFEKQNLKSHYGIMDNTCSEVGIGW